MPGNDDKDEILKSRLDALSALRDKLADVESTVIRAKLRLKAIEDDIKVQLLKIDCLLNEKRGEP